MIEFKFADDNKRYHTLSYYNKHKFGEKVYKAALDGGFTCPNIDGRCGVGGCTFCGGGAGDFTHPGSIERQIEAERERIAKKHPNLKIIAYFQAHTNTYAPLDVLREKYEAALGCEGVVGLSVATRADSLPEDVLDYLSELNERTNLTVELGLQSAHDRTAHAINRGYDFAVFEDAFSRLRERKIRICVHLINGLIGESGEDMVKSAEIVGKMRPDAVKIHLLYILRGTVCERQYLSGELRALEKDEYVDIVTRQLTYLPAECVIERLTGDGDKAKMIAPLWSRAKIAVLAAIDRRMAETGRVQGIMYN